MAFEHKKGSFTLFRNQKRTKDTHPHLTGEGVDLNGNAIQISVWEKEGRAGTFFSCSMKLKDAKPAPENNKKDDKTNFDNDDVPF